jgi:nicotinamide riboside kinase
VIVALLGAECTGKSSLTQLLGKRLAAATVPEYLREWCLAAGRTPQQQEQAAIAAEQQRRIVAAATASLLIADTTALMTAVYSQHYFGDDSLLADALAMHRRQVTLTLLCCPAGVPWQRDGCLRDGEAARQAVHALLVDLLRREGLPHELLQGPLPQRVEQAVSRLADIAGHNPRPC